MANFCAKSKKYTVILTAAAILAVTLYRCETDTNTSLEGSWKVQESHSYIGQYTFYVTIGANPDDPSVVYIDNFMRMGSGKEVYANVSGDNITLPSQDINGHTVEGSGTVVNNNRLEFSFTDNDGGNIEEVTSIFTR